MLQLTVPGTHSARSGEGVQRSAVGWLGRIVAIAAFFQVVCYGWLLFRATSFTQISEFTLKLSGLMAAPAGLTMPAPPFPAFVGLAFLLFWDVLTESTGKVRFYQTWPVVIRAGLYAGMIYLLAFGATTATSAFIYFQF